MLFSVLYGQINRDYIWLSGYAYRPVKGNIIDFNNKGIVDSLIIGMPIEDNNASICDKKGKLLMYSNGCKIYNYERELIENGDSINYGYGENWRRFCSSGYRGYIGIQNSIILPDPKDSNGYYLIHKTAELIIEPNNHYWRGDLLYSYIDMSCNEEKGCVVKKNVEILKDTNFVAGYMAACKHANGKDWWIIQLGKDTNIYYKFLLNKDSIVLIDTQSMGPKFDVWTDIGQAVFSPDGKKWIMYDDKEDAIIYDFDRATGELSNFRQVITQDSGRFVGVAISPNSRFAYLSSTYDLYQIDLWADDIQASLIHIDHWDGFNDYGFGVTFSNAQLAPDCKIYISSPTTVMHMSVINKPNEKGKACDFRQHAIEFPNLIGGSSIPNFPHFRIDEEQICDSTITWIPDDYIVKAPNVLSVYPNPASDKATISVYTEGYEQGIIRIFDMDGRLVRSMDIDSEATKQVDVKSLVPGVYAVEYVSYISGGRDVRKMVVVE